MIKIIVENHLQTKFTLVRFKNNVIFTKLKGDYFEMKFISFINLSLQKTEKIFH